ncbi:MAG: hypothetical protein LUF04_00045 [Bacteroides sp.]|nr:hypothetical protein [Bacteroides sp.]
MKIVQSYWSKPGVEHMSWAEKEMHYYSWTLSCLKLKQHYDKVELVTDQAGKELLIDRMRLPYDSVRVVLDDINHYSPVLWALGKIYAYSIQDEPFIHVDGDVFIWKKFSEKVEAGQLIAQHKQIAHESSEHYYEGLLRTEPDYFPEEITRFRDQVTTQYTEANAGILGGNDLDFIRSYCEEAFRFVDRAVDRALQAKYPHMFNVIFEQYLFYCMAHIRNKEITYQFKKTGGSYEETVRFKTIPYPPDFIHVMSYHKRKVLLCEKIIWHLWYEFPEHYEHINQLVKQIS